jgi:hypothetical protein
MTADDLHFMRLQTDSTDTLTVFAAQEFTNNGITTSEAWRQATLVLTESEQTAIAALIARAKTEISNAAE